MTSSAEEPPPWVAWADKRIGSAHRRRGQENQDAWRTLAIGDSAAVTVADGHGSATSFRSAVGSRYAVEVSIELAEELITSSSSAGRGREVGRLLEERAGKQLERQWRKRVEADLAERPFEPDELDRLAESSGTSKVNEVLADPPLAYGSTVLAAVATPSFMAFWQLGDGDVVVVGADGRAAKPIPPDPQLMGNATVSLCSRDAWRYLRSAYSGSPAQLVLVSTDGLANSYADDAGFLRFGSDLLKRITDEGWDAVVEQIPEWLSRISEKGSGDDMSLGLLCSRSLSRNADRCDEGT